MATIRHIPGKGDEVEELEGPDEVIVLMPPASDLPEDVVSRIDAFLQERFPAHRCKIVPGLTGSDDRFCALPLAALGPLTISLKMSFEVAAKLGEITAALEEFRAAGWKRKLN